MIKFGVALSSCQAHVARVNINFGGNKNIFYLSVVLAFKSCTFGIACASCVKKDLVLVRENIY